MLRDLLTSPTREKELLAGSHYHSDFEHWTRARKFLADLITQSGTVLDVGCANGLLLRCFQEWAAYEIEPFGVDPDRNKLEEARKLFPEAGDNFIELSILELAQLPSHGAPKEFDTVYWNVWDNWDFSQPDHIAGAGQVHAATASHGRVIFGFYDRQSAAIECKIEKLTELFGKASGRVENLPRREVAIWWDK